MAGLKASYGRARHSLANILDLIFLVFNANVAGNVSYKRYLCARWWRFMMIAAGSWKCYFIFAIFNGHRLRLGL